MVDDPHIGGLSAVYTIDHATVKGPVADYLVAGERAQFAGFNLDDMALAMHSRRPIDLLYAVLLVPSELYMWIRMGHFTAAWVRFFARHRGFRGLSTRDESTRGCGVDCARRP